MKLEQIETELKKASNGLLMKSETDEPFEYFYDEQHDASQLNNATVLKLAGMPAGYPMDVIDIDHFFRNMTRVQDENVPNNKEQAQRFQQLVGKLKETLQEVKAYCIGEQRITVFILGKTEDGYIAGLKTVLVET